MASTIPACSEGCAHHSGWTHTLHLPPHWTGVFRGLGWLGVLAIAPLPGSRAHEWDQEEQGRERGNKG